MIEIRNVYKRFGSQVVLDGVTLTVQEGETLALLGPSGTGKSVLLKSIIGLIRPERGEIVVDGQIVSRLKRQELARLRATIGYVFQNGALFDSMDVFENIRLGLTNEKEFKDLDYARKRAAECLRLVNLNPDTMKKMPAELSGGMRKRVGIARAIAGKPKYVLYDEPTSGLDPGQRRHHRRAGQAARRRTWGHQHHGDPRRARGVPHGGPHRAAHPRQDRGDRATRGVPRIAGAGSEGVPRTRLRDRFSERNGQMNSYQKEILVGVFVLVAVSAFVAGALWLRGKGVGRDDVYVVFSDVATLKDASTVRISGAQVGRVDGINFIAPGRVIVGLKFAKKNQVRVTSTAAATVTAIGMLGDYMVVLDPGKGTPLQRGDTIRGTVAAGVFDKASEVATKASETMTRLNAMLDTQLVVELRHTLVSTQKFMKYLADEKNGPTAQVNPTMVALQNTSARLDSTLAQVDPGRLQTRLDSTMRSAGGAADRLAATAARADSLMAIIQHGNGTMGRLMNDSTMYGDLRKALQEMTALLAEIKKNPGKIGVTVKVF